MTAASIAVPPEADLVRIATVAGNAAMEARRYEAGRLYVEGVTQAALDAALASVGTAAPPPVRSVTPREFRQRFTAAERGAITLAASRALEAGDPTLQMFLDDLSASQVVELDHPDTVAGIAAVVAAGLLSAARGAAILA